jgi:hypothetical protein
MTRQIVDLEKNEAAPKDAPPLSTYSPSNGRRRVKKVIAIFAALVLVSLCVSTIGGFLYWRHLKTTPQYSLALLIEAARNDDQNSIDNLVNTDAVVEDFVPQVTDKAIELYGRGLAPDVVKRTATIAAPIMPLVKERAKAELPRLLRERTKRFEKVPFVVMAAGAGRYLDIKVEGDVAKIKDRSNRVPLELTMKRTKDRWQIVAIKDDALAKRIAEKLGQQIIALIRDNGTATIDKVGKKIGIENLGDLIKKAEEIFK